MQITGTSSIVGTLTMEVRDPMLRAYRSISIKSGDVRNVSDDLRYATEITDAVSLGLITLSFADEDDASQEDISGLSPGSGGGSGPPLKEIGPLERWAAAIPIGNEGLNNFGFATRDALYAMPFYSGPGGHMTKIGYREVVGGIANAVVRLGVYQATSTSNIYPSARLLDSGEISVTASGAYSVTVDLTLEPDTMYWFTWFSSDSEGDLNVHLTPLGYDFYSVATPYGYDFENMLASEKNGFLYGIAKTTVYGAFPSIFPSGAVSATAFTDPIAGQLLQLPAIFAKFT